MLPINHTLLQHLSTIFQMKDRSPVCAVQVYHPITGQRMQLERIDSVEVDRRYDAPAAEFSVVLDNTAGWYSPDYNYKKFGKFTDLAGVGVQDGNPWPGVLWPNTVVEIWLGYGKDYRKIVTGLIDTISITAGGRTLTVKGRSMYKKLLVETVKPHQLNDKKNGKLVYKNKSVKYIVDDIHKKVGVPINSTDIKIWGTNETYIVPSLELERGQTYDSCINDLITSTYARVWSDPNGRTIMRPVRILQPNATPNVVLDEAINLTDLDYSIEDQDIKTNLVIKCGKHVSMFEDAYLRKNICRGQYREEVIELAWANTKAKRAQAAKAYFRKYKQSLRAVSLGVVGNPVLELYDLARVYEHTSQATANYMIKSIRSTFSSAGYFDIIDAEIA